MIKRLALLLLMAPLLTFAQPRVSIIPQPGEMTIHEGVFVMDGSTSLQYAASDKSLQAAAQFLSAHIKHISGLQLPSNKPASKVIKLVLKSMPALGSEGYELKVSPSGIDIIANNKAGIIYGMQSVIQTLPAIRTNALLQVPCMVIKDQPRFKWRGMHLDVSRHFFSAELVKSFIDLMALYKMNTFHWHLVDDPGWRIEIKKYPSLTTTGAWRVDQNHKAWGDRPQAKPGETPTYGGYYSQEQIREIIAYAAQRNVTIVPEIEMPGHVASAIAAMPQLSCNQKPQLPMTGGNYSNMSSNYCAGNDHVYAFLEDVLTEVIALFPSKYIHIGGDEVDKSSWKKCDKCQAKMKAEGLKTEEELQSYFIKRIEKFIVSKNRKMVGWDEILEGGLAPEATVMSWRGEAGGIEAAKMNHDVVMTPGSPCYFDHYQGDPALEPLAIGGFNTLRRVYDYEPIPKELNAQQAKYVLGAQANLWTEFVPTAEHVEYMILPRMLALAEVVWSPSSRKNWADFNERLQPHFRMFEQKGLHYSKGNFKVDIKPISTNGNLEVAMQTELYKGDIHYTTNGQQPTLQSQVYTRPVPINGTTTVKAIAAVDGQLAAGPPAEQRFVMHKATGANVRYTYPNSNSYMADGPNALTDGLRGTQALGKYWHGFSGKDLIATIDLGKMVSIQKISLGCLQHYKDWVFMPAGVTFEVSEDGINYRTAGNASNPIDINQRSLVIHDFAVSFAAQNARYIRVSAKAIEGCPKGHPGEGKPGWIFADEVVVE